jgi:hypothetical protein
MSGLALSAALLEGIGCGHAQLPPLLEAKGNLHGFGVVPHADPTVLGARLLPELIDDEKSFGLEPGGGVRGVASGVRVVSLANGAVLAAEDRLPQPPTITVGLPDRLGGGFLFVIAAPGSTVVWRAERWLSRAVPLFGSSTPINEIVVGLDRIYLRGTNGAARAIDPRTGGLLDRGAWPASPYVGAYAALDGWRALAITDLRGVVATDDAGVTWKPLYLPMDPKKITSLGDSLAVGGFVDNTRTLTWYEVRRDGQVARIGALPKPVPSEHVMSLDPVTKSFGKRPLTAAIEDGWPLADGTAVVARDGSLARVRLADGALIDIASDAFAMKPARCHPVPMGRPPAFGFVCGEPRGKTVLYTFDPQRGRVVELKRFDQPRAVFAAGNGAIVVRGGCADAAPSNDAQQGQQSYCLLPREAVARGAEGFREVLLQGEVGGERVTLLGDGRLAVLSPPRGDLSTARLTILDERGKAATRAIAFSLTPETERVLKAGIWLEGFEERTPGTLSGWVEAGGTMLGLRIDVDGHATVGKFVRDAGATVVSGRYGLGWAASKRGYETIDGGMTWTDIDLPEPIGNLRLATTRACGPVGCMNAGWLRVGWGAPKAPPHDEPVRPSDLREPPQPPFELACEPLGGPPPPTSTASIPIVDHSERVMWGGGHPIALHPMVTSDWQPLYAAGAPPLRPDEVGASTEWAGKFEDALGVLTSGPLVRLFAWGTKGPDWEHSSKWMARWVWPFGSSQEVFSSLAIAAPRAVIEASRFGPLGVTRNISAWKIEPGDDSHHALLSAKRSGPDETILFELEADRAPTEAHRLDAEPFTEIESAVRLGGHWYVAGPSAPAEQTASVVWAIEGGHARELARIPRAAADNARPPPLRLARRSDGRAIGVVVEGQAAAERPGVALRWLLPVDVESGARGEPEPLGAVDFEDRQTISLCNGDEAGWVIDLPWTRATVMAAASPTRQTLGRAFARVRISRNRMCIERMSGAIDGGSDGLARQSRGNPPRTEAISVDVSVFAAHARFPLRCVRR